MPYLANDSGFSGLDDDSCDSSGSYVSDTGSQSPVLSSTNQRLPGCTSSSFDYEDCEEALANQELSERSQDIDSQTDGDDDSSSIATEDHDRSDNLSEGEGDTPNSTSSQLRATSSSLEYGPMTRREFSKEMLELESEADLQLLYPPSLWQHSNGDDWETEAKDINQMFPTPLSNENWRELEIDEFCIYNDFNNSKYPGQYESLHRVYSKQGKKKYLLDGIVRSEGHDFTYIGAEIVKVRIDGLESTCHSCEDQYWIQTKHSAKSDGWFRLTTPATAYANIWSDFAWVANFAKYCVDYLLLAEHEQRLVILEDFRSDFVTRLIQQHHSDVLNSVQNWLQDFGDTPDFRRHLVQFEKFVFKVCCAAGLSVNLRKHPVWKDIGHSALSRSVTREKTLVTRNTARTFLKAFPHWGPTNLNLLRQADCEAHVQSQRQERMKHLRLPDKFAARADDDFQVVDNQKISKVERILYEASKSDQSVSCTPEELVKKLVVVRQQEKGDYYFDFAYVNSLSGNKQNVRITWMDVPSRTICTTSAAGKRDNRQKARYPIGNELFFSDDCNCFAVSIKNIVGVFEIKILDEVDRGKCDLFATTLYLEQEESFVRVTEQQLRFMCSPICTRSKSSYATGSSNASPRRSRSIKRSDMDVCQEDLHDKRLTNLSLFTGCGLLDRGLEASGKLHTILSIDANAFAMCSAKANVVANGEDDITEFVVESVNTELLKIMEGHRPYPKPGCLSSGSPCRGFSIANNDRHKIRGQLDCTLLASTMSWVEVTLPAYFLLENVPQIDTGSPSACSQGISFLVALGYQVRKLKLMAIDYGGSTKRTRLFILAAAPAVKLPDRPKPTHGAPPLKRYVTIEDVISDLAPIHNDILINIRSPYHVPLVRLSSNLTTSGVNFRDMIRRIPISPAGQCLFDSRCLMTNVQRAWIEERYLAKQVTKHKAAQRIQGKGHFRTILTGVHWRCANTGELIHYEQHRVLSLEEVARAQGIPNDFVLVGCASQKLRQVGNAVPWCLREAIGREIAKAYAQSEPLVEDALPDRMERSEAGDDEAGDDEAGDDEAGDDEVGDDEAGDDEAGDDEVVFSSKDDFEKVLQQRHPLEKKSLSVANISRAELNSRSLDQFLQGDQQPVNSFQVSLRRSGTEKRLRSHIEVDEDHYGNSTGKSPSKKLANLRLGTNMATNSGPPAANGNVENRWDMFSLQ